MLSLSLRTPRSFSKSFSRFIMLRTIHLDASPPPYNGDLTRLDRTVFRKTLHVLGARVEPTKAAAFRRAEPIKSSLIGLHKVKSIINDPNDPEGNRLVLLNATNEADLCPETLNYVREESKGLVPWTIDLDYDYWTSDELLQVILPEELREGAPSGFSMTGHIAHVNLNNEYLPYKHIIGQLILDKNRSIKTVVNKLDTIDNKFRFFKMELLAGEPNYVVEHHESECRFTFDFTQVYWNSRLHTEHDRLVELFKPNDVVADVFAGVGPFAIPAAKKGCAVIANDLNPESFKYLNLNVQNNRVADLVQTYCEDGRDFIRHAVERVIDHSFPEYGGPRRKLDRAQAELKALQNLLSQHSGKPRGKVRRRISHFVLNLPDTAIEFLNAFRGIISPDVKHVYDIMPMIHCHCFTRELEPDKAEQDIRERVEASLGSSLTDDMGLHFVRSVAPHKHMYCLSFRLPTEVAYDSQNPASEVGTMA